MRRVLYDSAEERMMTEIHPEQLPREIDASPVDEPSKGWYHYMYLLNSFIVDLG